MSWRRVVSHNIPIVIKVSAENDFLAQGQVRSFREEIVQISPHLPGTLQLIHLTFSPSRGTFNLLKNPTRMRYTIICLSFLAVFASSLGQAPNAFNYQAVVRNLDGAIRANEQVDFEINIVKDSVDGITVYTESYSTLTNQLGLVNLVIGSGVTEYSLDSIDWSLGIYFLEILVDGIYLGANQILSVPYALYASEAGEVKSLYYDLGSLKISLTGVTSSGYEFDEVFKCEYGEVRFPSYYYMSEFVEGKVHFVIMATQGTTRNSIYIQMIADNIADNNSFRLDMFSILYNGTLDDGSIFHVNTYFSAHWDDFMNIEEFNTATGVYRGQFEYDSGNSHPAFKALNLSCNFDITLKNSRSHLPKPDDFIF